jgi:hypothetical protein
VPAELAPDAAERPGPSRARRAFEPERDFGTAPADFVSDDFSDREIGILCEQGNFERARVLLSRRALGASGDAQLFLDAIRMERSAAPGGAAWQAWVSRALAAGAQVAPRLHALVPQEALRAFLAREAIGWTALERQRDLPAARELLRLRLDHELDLEPVAALRALEEPALVEAAARDAALLRLALGALAAAAFVDPTRVAALAARYGVDPRATGPADDGAGADGSAAAFAESRDPGELLRRALHLQPAWAAATARAPSPAALDRFARAGLVIGSARARALLAALHADLRARPREYLRCAVAIADAPDGLAPWLIAALQSAARELAAPPPADPEQPAEGPQRPEQHDALRACAQALARHPLRRASPAAAVAAAAALAPAFWIAPTAALLGAALLPALWWLLRRVLNAQLYRRAARAALLDAVIAEQASARELVAAMRAHPSRALRRLAAYAALDPALGLIAAIASLGPAADARA